MKNLIFSGIFVLIFFNACLDGDKPEINGMWQLKTIQGENSGNGIIDTIFYSFQRQSLFAYTELYETGGKPATSSIIYGYIDFAQGDNRLHIQLDEKYNGSAGLLLWNRGEESPLDSVTYDIVKLDSKYLRLFHKGKTYNFIRY
jgi:hypothetical protein